MQNPAQTTGALVMAYLLLRKAIGILGVLLPFALGLGALAFFGTLVALTIVGRFLAFQVPALRRMRVYVLSNNHRPTDVRKLDR